MSLSILSLNRLRVFIGVSLLMIPATAQSQIVDWIIDQAAQSIVNEAEYQLNKLGNSLWNPFIESNTESSVIKKADTLKDIPISRSKELEVTQKYSDVLLFQYPEIYSSMVNRTNSYLNPLKNIKMSELGQGSVWMASQRMQDSIRSNTVIGQLSELITQQVLDSLYIMEGKERLEELLLEDINHSVAIAVLLNNHPEAVRVYANSADTYLRRDLSHLYYWSVAADIHRKILSKKKRLINPRNIKFVHSDSGVEILCGNQKHGEILGNKIICNTIDLLNLCGASNKEYYYGNMIYKTDKLGRVIESIQLVGDDYKGKCKEKGSMRSKDFAAIKSDKLFKRMYRLGFSKYQSPDCNMNTVYVKNNSEYKKYKKQVKKIEKEISKTKSNYEVATILDYHDDGTLYCRRLEVSFIIVQNGIRVVINQARFM